MRLETIAEKKLAHLVNLSCSGSVIFNAETHIYKKPMFYEPKWVWNQYQKALVRRIISSSFVGMIYSSEAHT